MTDIPLGDLALNFGVSALAVLVFIAVVIGRSHPHEQSLDHRHLLGGLALPSSPPSRT